MHATIRTGLTRGLTDGLTARLTRENGCVRATLPSGTPVEVAAAPLGGATNAGATHDGAARTGLVIAPDIFGLRPLYDEMVAHLARTWGMPVAAVEPFPGRTLGPEIEPRVAQVPTLDDDAHLRDLEDAAQRLGTPRVALMGFCMGGMYCLKSVRSARFDRIVSFYGMIRVPERWRSAGQREPLGYLSDTDGTNADRVLAILGGKDPYTPPDDVRALRLTGTTVVLYEEADHAFAHDPARPVHRPDDAADAFARAREWVTDVR
jgi:carboxymethylenebutenolidase